jgi:hypothetical protein
MIREKRHEKLHILKKHIRLINFIIIQLGTQIQNNKTSLAPMEGKILFIPIFHRDKKIGMTAGTISTEKAQ